MPEEQTQIGPARISFATFLLKILAAGVGGSVGGLILVLIFLLSSTLIAPIASDLTEISAGPVFIFMLLIMVFLATTAGNLLATFLTALTEREKYKRTASAIIQIAVFSVIIFLFMVPVYFITSTVDISLVVYAVALHIILTAQLSALTLEMVSNYKYSLVGLYGTTLSIIISAAVLFGLSTIITNPAILLFAALPIIWGSMGFVQTITAMTYGWLARLYDKDFLSTQTVYGEDYGKEVEEQESAEPVVQDESGADFLRKNK